MKIMNDLIIQTHPLIDENLSNLTTASGEASVSSTNKADNALFASPNPQSNHAKKKRSLPGNPDPDAEVIALSPKTLLATNRFICEVCNKGFQRDQNLQLHRRGHNLPWKLKQRASKEVKKKVYVCPETSCVHHHPSRALGDLTGIKKHFCRKHGEKKWKCDKCSKKYAVQSDWKAHSKTCGTREYKCDCGTLFSRRDSFITHRAFCDALAEESARTIPSSAHTLTNPLLFSQDTAAVETSNHNHVFPQVLRTTDATTTINSHECEALSLKRDQQQSQHQLNLRPWLATAPTTSLPHLDIPNSIFSTRLENEFPQPKSLPQEGLASSFPQPHFQSVTSPHMSATALLQKAAQMGATMSKASDTASAGATSGFGLGLPSQGQMDGGFVHGLSAFGNNNQNNTDKAPLIQDMVMDSLSSATGFHGSFEEAFGGGFWGTKREPNNHNNVRSGERGGVSDGMTRDFLSLKTFSQKDMLNIGGVDPCMSASPYGDPQ
ncbi:Zinc finger protein MAGPIE [Acorus calamus]|uniref:Protein EARLY HEADING DATE 2 n=1 Tax=Acorus calamus TaxID=4465 RepID=A0AAV9E0Y9_ACOCL|nr:Zinc finger protein MAGPIE [Acorus calamus]